MIDITNFRGIDNRNDPHRLRITGSGAFLREGTNLYIDDTGAIVSRDGYAQSLAGDFHSIYPYNGKLYGVKDSDLVSIAVQQGNRVALLQSEVGTHPFSFTVAGPWLVGTNNSIIGYVDGDTWTLFPATTETYKRRMPAGHIAEYWRGRLFVAVDNLVVHSDPAAYFYYDVREDANILQFPSRVRMVRGVDDGIWFSDDTNLIFARGESPTDFRARIVTDYPAIEGTASQLMENVIWRTLFLAQAFFVTTPSGICVCGNAGQFVNLTEDSYIIPFASQGACTLFDNDTARQYISILT